MDFNKKFLILALGGIVGIIIVGIILNVSRPIKKPDPLKGRSISSSEVETVSFDTAGNEIGMVIVSNWEDTEVSEVVTEDTEEKRSFIRRLEDVEGLFPDPDTGYIFVGDSRFVNMNDVCEISKRDNLFMVAKVGEGYSWFSETALSQIKRIVSSGLYSKWKLIICLGINDLGSLEKYLKKYEALKADYDITLVSVNPVNNYGTLSNEQIKKFNSSLEELGLPYIDTFSMLMTTGYSTTDGLHYSGDTTKKIYNGILMGLEELNPGTLVPDTGSTLDKNSLSKKKSLQSEILAQNKYVKKTPPAPEVPAAAVSAATAPQTAGTAKPADTATANDQVPSPEELERMLREMEELEGNRREEEERPPEESEEEKHEEEQPSEPEQEEEDSDDDD